MKSLLSIAILGIICVTNLQCSTSWNSIKGNGNITTQTRTTENYDAINVSGFYDVVLIAGEEGKITVKAEDNLQEYIVTEVEDNKLSIYTKNGVNLSSNRNIEILVPVTTIEEVRLTGSGSIKSDTDLRSENFKASVTGSGDVMLNIVSKETEASVTGSGTLRLAGTSEYFDGKVTGSGNLKADDLRTIHTKAHVSGSGDIDVFCSGNLKASVTGSGDIGYSGNPETRDFSTTGSGDIYKR